MSPEERREVLEQLLERVRRNAAERGRAVPLEENHAQGNNNHAVDYASDSQTLDLVPPRVAPTPTPSRPLVRFEFEDEQTSTGDPDQIEALVLAEAAAAEAAARGDSEEPLSGPSTIPPALPPISGSDGPGRLELEDLDSLGPPPGYQPPQTSVPPPPPSYLTPPPLPPAYVGSPPSYDPPPAYEPAPPPPAYVAPPPYEPPPPAYEPPPYVAEPPRYLTEPPPAAEAEGEILIDDEAVIELDEADLRSVPPEPGPMEAAFDAASSPPEEDYGEHGPQTDHAGFVDRSSLADIEAAVLPAAADAEPPPEPEPEPIPESQRQKRELDRPIDDVLEGVEEPPPESGEVESQRYPANATPIVDEVSAERIAEADLDEAPTPPPLSRAAAPEPIDLASPARVERPIPAAADVATFGGARPREVSSFGDLLDLALTLGD